MGQEARHGAVVRERQGMVMVVVMVWDRHGAVVWGRHGAVYRAVGGARGRTG